MASTVTLKTTEAVMSNSILILQVGKIIALLLIILLILKEFLPLIVESTRLDDFKSFYLMELLSDIVVGPFFFVFTYIIVYHAVKLLSSM
ncbi:MAG: hypothetical protein GX088_07640 [Clostridia bacterium]|nr:hypothetical protein [Clostridia bacterium]